MLPESRHPCPQALATPKDLKKEEGVTPRRGDQVVSPVPVLGTCYPHHSPSCPLPLRAAAILLTFIVGGGRGAEAINTTSQVANFESQNHN